MSEIHKIAVNEDDYIAGRKIRITKDDLEVEQWYKYRETSPKIIELGVFAVEMLVEVNLITPSDKDFDIEVSLLDMDEELVSELKAKIKVDGLIYNQIDEPDEGYFLDIYHDLDDQLLTMTQQTITPSLAH